MSARAASRLDIDPETRDEASVLAEIEPWREEPAGAAVRDV